MNAIPERLHLRLERNIIIVRLRLLLKSIRIFIGILADGFICSLW
jgi:hypothetical protein